MLKNYGIKQVISKKIFVILITGFIFISFSELNSLKIEDFNNKNIVGLGHSVGINKDREMLERAVSTYLKGEEAVPYFNLAFKSTDLAMENLEQENYIEAYRNEMMVKIINLNLYSHLEQREYIEPIAKPIWEDICQGIKYPDNNGKEFDIDKQSVEDTNTDFKYWLTHLKYLYTCYNLGIPYVENDSANNMVFLYKIMDKVIPIFTMLFIILLAYDTVSVEHMNHVSKNILSQPTRRTKYLYQKFISNITAMVLAIMITITIVCLFATVYTGWHSMNMPIVTTNNQWNTITHNGMDITKEVYNTNNLGPTSIEWKTFSTEILDLVKIKFLPFWKVILIYSFEMFLFVIFILGITIYASAMTNKKSISMGISISIIGGLYLIYKYFPKIANPLLAIDTRNIISGASNFTLLSLTLIQIISIIIVFLIGNYLFNRKDISY